VIRSAVLGSLALAACGGDDGTSGGDAAHQTCITETNKYRAMAGRAPVMHSPELEAYADEGAEYDFSSSPHAHFSATQGGGIAAAENECPRQGGWTVPLDGNLSTIVAECVAAFFAEGPGGGHYENMMGPYAKLGCGIYAQGIGVTIIQDFGN
jgi:hypothetical protein